jgi:cbb3-type cytochrome oxidase subunit 3
MNLIYEHAPSISLIFFFTFFVWVAFRAYRPSAKQSMKEHAFIPLQQESDHER